MKTINRDDFDQLLLRHHTWRADFLANFAIGKSTPDDGILKLNNVELRDVVFKGDLTGSEIMRATILNCTFQNCLLGTSDLLGTTFSHCTFHESTFLKTDFRTAKIIESNLNDCDFTRSDLTDAAIIKTNLDTVSLDYTWLLRTDMRNSTFTRCSFNHSHISMIRVHQCFFVEPSLVNIDASSEVDASEQADGTDVMPLAQYLNKQ